MLHDAPLRILTSFCFYKNADLFKVIEKRLDGYRPDWFADSGAYSAMMHNITIDINAYIGWLDYHKELFSVYTNLDVIGDGQATFDNHMRMLDAGLNPLPVFHVGDDWHYLERYIEMGYLYIGIGGSSPHIQNPKLNAWLVRAFKLCDGKAALHGLGITRLSLIRLFNWHSVDSTAFIEGAAYDNMPLFDKSRGKFIKIHIKDRRAWYDNRHLLNRYGYSLSDFADKSKQTNEVKVALGGLAYREFEGYIRSKQGTGVALQSPNDSGFKLYLSNSNIVNFVYVLRALRNRSIIK